MNKNLDALMYIYGVPMRNLNDIFKRVHIIM